MESRTEERINALTHGLGVLASLVGSIVLIGFVSRFGDGWELLSVAIYSASLLVLYSASTLYHSARADGIRKKLRVFDHCAIYILIAGSYTPFALGPLRGPLGWIMLIAVWAFAVVGIVRRCLITDCPARMSTKSYLAMGWICLVPFIPSLRLVSTSALLLLVVGGMAYMAGTLFYRSRRIPYAHTIWHGFVLAGSGAHFAAIFIQLT